MKFDEPAALRGPEIPDPAMSSCVKTAERWCCKVFVLIIASVYASGVLWDIFDVLTWRIWNCEKKVFIPGDIKESISLLDLSTLICMSSLHIDKSETLTAP